MVGKDEQLTLITPHAHTIRQGNRHIAASGLHIALEGYRMWPIKTEE